MHVFTTPARQILWGLPYVFLSCLLGSFFCPVSVQAQLNGTYSIGSSEADFATLEAAVTALESQGVSGPVTFQVLPGRYEEAVVIGQVPGSSCDLPVVFAGEAANRGSVVIAPPEGVLFAIQVNGADGISFKNMNILADVDLQPGTDCFVLENNVLNGNISASSTETKTSNFHQYLNNTLLEGGIRKELSGWDINTPVFDEGLVIDGNVTGGITIIGQRDFTVNNNQSDHGEILIENSWYGQEISGNEVRIETLEYTGTAFTLRSAAAALISRNTTFLLDGGKAMEITTGKTTGGEILIANNLVQSSGNDARGNFFDPIALLEALSIESNYGNTIKLYHNTIATSGNAGVVPSYTLQLSGEANSFDIKNNFIQDGASVDHFIIVEEPAIIAEMDYNNLAGFNFLYGNQEIRTFTEWQSITGFDQNSINARSSSRSPAPALQGAGIYLSEVPEDYYGQQRSDPPTIGAVEKAFEAPPGLSGIYTLGGSQSDYGNFAEAIADLQRLGVEDSAIFRVQPGTYQEPIRITNLNINGRLIFEGISGDSTRIIVDNPAGEAVYLEDARNITFRSMTLKNVFFRNVGSLTFENNRIQGGVSSSFAIPRGSNGGLVFRNNFFQDGNLEVKNSCERFEKGGSVRVTDNVLENSRISVVCATGVVISRNKINIQAGEGISTIGISTQGITNFEELKYNDIKISGARGTGIYLGSFSFDMSMPDSISYNQVLLSDGGTGFDFGYGAPEDVAFYNNLIAVKAGEGSRGIVTPREGNLHIFYTTVYLYGNTDPESYALYAPDDDFVKVEVESTLLANLAGGYVIGSDFDDDISSWLINSDYNNLYTSGATLAKWGRSGVTAEDLSAWRSSTTYDDRSLSVDPQFDSPEKLIPGNRDLKGAAIVVGSVTEDFYGNRRAYPPTIGAVEFPEETQNQAPTVNAGSDRTLALPLERVVLRGSGNDPDGVFRGFLWEKISGPEVSLSQQNIANLVLTDLKKGEYVFRFTATDNEGASGSDEVVLTLTQPNQPPVADAGRDRTVLLPLDRLVLPGIARDPDGRFRAFRWDKISGPEVSLQQQNTANLILTDLRAGEYVFRFTATDNDGASASDEVMLTVEQLNLPPVVSAGPDKVVTSAVERVLLAGIGYDPDGRFSAFRWEKVSGPEVTLNQPHTANLILTDLQEGEYVFRFSATDNEGATTSDEMMLTVEPAAILARQEKNTKMRAYPNNFQQLINLEVEDAEEAVYHVEIYDMNGKVYHRSQFNADPFFSEAHQIDLREVNMSRGLYLIRVENSSRTFRQILKVIKGS